MRNHRELVCSWLLQLGFGIRLLWVLRPYPRPLARGTVGVDQCLVQLCYGALSLGFAVMLGLPYLSPLLRHCGPGGFNSVVPEKKPKKKAIENYLTGECNVQAIITLVANGQNFMPAW